MKFIISILLLLTLGVEGYSQSIKAAGQSFQFCINQKSPAYSEESGWALSLNGLNIEVCLQSDQCYQMKAKYIEVEQLDGGFRLERYVVKFNEEADEFEAVNLTLEKGRLVQVVWAMREEGYEWHYIFHPN